jgi:hypothetical protein
MAKVYVSRNDLRHFPAINKKIRPLERLCLRIGKSRLSVSAVFIVLAIVWIVSPLTAFAQQWVLIGKGSENLLWYYDSSSVKHLPGNIVQVSVKMALASKNIDRWALGSLRFCQMLNEAYKDVKGDYSYDVSIREFNCAAHEHRTISLTYYDENGNILCKDSSPGLDTWLKLDLNNKNNLDTLVYQAVCK